MTTAEWITASVVFIIAAILAVVSIRSFLNKGFLFNNAYIYASKEDVKRRIEGGGACELKSA